TPPNPPNTPGNLGGIAFDANGNIWFTEIAADKIGVASQAGALLHEFPIATGSLAHRIVAGPDGNFWFTESGTNLIGRIKPDGTVTEFPIPTGSTPFDITVGPDGNLWYTDNDSNKIGRITTAGVVTEFTIPTPFVHDPNSPHGNPVGITTGPDG